MPDSKLKNKPLFFTGCFIVLAIPLLFLLQQKISVWPVQYNRNTFYHAFLLREKIHSATLEALHKPDGWKKTAHLWLDKNDPLSALTWVHFGAEHHSDPSAMLLLGKIYMGQSPQQAGLFFRQALKMDNGRLSQAERDFCQKAVEELK